MATTFEVLAGAVVTCFTAYLAYLTTAAVRRPPPAPHDDGGTGEGV